MRTFGRTVGRDAARYRGRVRVSFPALLTSHRSTPANPTPRPYLYDLTVEFVFEALILAEPGVVVDDDMRAEIEQHVAMRLAHRDLTACSTGRPPVSSSPATSRTGTGAPPGPPATPGWSP
jgi:hypothetical protein